MKESEYMCLSCLAITKASDLKEVGVCPKCEDDSLMKTYNASESDYFFQ